MTKKRIGEFLVEDGYVTQDQVEEALRVQRRKDERICSILIDLGHLSEEKLFEFLKERPGVSGVDFLSYDVDREIVELVPAEVALRLEVAPIGRVGGLLTVAMVCPLDKEGIEELEDTTGLRMRPVVCSRPVVRYAIDRYYAGSQKVGCDDVQDEDIAGLENSMKLRRINKLVEEIDELPTLPDILTLVSSVVNDPKSSAADLARIISSDASLAAKILKVANSAAYGFFREISDVQQAVTLLGFKETQSLVLSVSVFDYLTNLTELEFKAYWNHSFKCATLSRLISFNLGSSGIEGAFVAGLLHDIGKVALSVTMRGRQDRVVSLCLEKGIDGAEAEEKVFGLTHAEAGYLLGDHWLLPVDLTSTIRYHHSPETGGDVKELAYIVLLADTFCKLDASELKRDPPLSDDILDILAALKLSENSLRNALNLYSYLIPEAVLF